MNELSEEQEKEFIGTLWKAFIKNKADYIRMDGYEARHKYLRDVWCFALDNGYIEPVDISLDQETFVKGYLTEKGKNLLSNYVISDNLR